MLLDKRCKGTRAFALRPDGPVVGTLLLLAGALTELLTLYRLPRRNTIASVPACQQYVGVPLPGDAPSRFQRVDSSTRRDGQLQAPQGAAWGGQDWGLDLGDAAR